MTGKIYKCKCGCNLFINVTPHQYDERDVTGWSNTLIPAIAGSVSILICVNCFQIIVPPANMGGKTMMDPNVAAYSELLKWVKEHNKPKPEHVCTCPPKKIIFDNHREWDVADQIEEEMGKLDKQTNPSKDSFANQQEKNSEPRNVTKKKTGKKTKDQKMIDLDNGKKVKPLSNQ